MRVLDFDSGGQSFFRGILHPHLLGDCRPNRFSRARTAARLWFLFGWWLFFNGHPLAQPPRQTQPEPLPASKKQGSYFEPDFRLETPPFFDSAFSFNAYSDGR